MIWFDENYGAFAAGSLG